MKWLRNWAVIAVGTLIAAHTSSGISFDSYWTLLGVVIVISFLNALLRPLLILFTLPFIIFTLGLGLILINALLIKWTGALIDGFEVASWGSAIWAALVIGITSFFANVLFGEQKSEIQVDVGKGGLQAKRSKRSTQQEVIKDDDVIDI